MSTSALMEKNIFDKCSRKKMVTNTQTLLTKMQTITDKWNMLLHKTHLIHKLTTGKIMEL